MNKKLYKKVVATKDKLEAAVNLLQDHLTELKLIVDLKEKDSFPKNKSTASLVNQIVEDAVSDAKESLNRLNIK